MRVFTGSGGAVYLLGEPLSSGHRPRSLLARVGHWHVRFADQIAIGEQTMDGNVPVGFRRDGVCATMETLEFRPDLPLALDDDVLVDLDVAGGSLVGETKLPAYLAAGQRQEPLVIDNIKEVVFHA